MTRLDVLRRVPQRPRDLIRDLERILEDHLIDPGAHQLIAGCARDNIRGILSLFFRREELDEAVTALSDGRFHQDTVFFDNLYLILNHK